jgi:hypothetical protein
MTTRKNVRPLDAIAEDINKLERKNIFDIGDLLLEARAQCEPGQWLDWLDAEFDQSVDTAERYIKVAELTARLRKLRNLRLSKTTLYQLADHGDEEDLPSIIAELAKHATRKRLKPNDAERVIKIGISRRRFGDHPDATLVALVMADAFCYRSCYEKLIAALLELRPDTDEAANSIVEETWRADLEMHEEADDDGDEADSILDGAPPVLPPPATPPRPQKLTADTDWVETDVFTDAVSTLRTLRAKPAARFIGKFPPDDLDELASFLSAVAAADRKQITASTEAA